MANGRFALVLAAAGDMDTRVPLLAGMVIGAFCNAPNSLALTFGSAGIVSVRRGPPRALVAVAAFALLGLLAPPSHAQSREPFDTLSVALRISANINRTSFHEFWDPGAGIELGFDTPFYLGFVEVGAHYNAFSAREPDQPDFKSVFPFFGWGIDAPIGAEMHWYAGSRIGSFIMYFDTEEVNQKEQELALALGSHLRYRLSPDWSLEVGSRYREVFTHRRLRYVFLTVGIARSMASPGWLREFLE